MQKLYDSGGGIKKLKNSKRVKDFFILFWVIYNQTKIFTQFIPLNYLFCSFVSS